MLVTFLLACTTSTSFEQREADAAFVCYDGGALVFASLTTTDEMGPLIVQYYEDVVAWQEDHQKWCSTQKRNQTDEERARCVRHVMLLAARETGTGKARRDPQQECLPAEGSTEKVERPTRPDAVEPVEYKPRKWLFKDHGDWVDVSGSCIYRKHASP